MTELVAPADDQPPQRLYLHIGLPKSGSTFLQSVLAGNRGVLREHGYAYPYVRQEGMFHAAVEVAGVPGRWGLDEVAISGTFAHLIRRGRRLGGTVVLSHEIFGNASLEQIDAIGRQLTDFDVRLVLTVRNIGRTITADWQEGVKNGRNLSFADFSGRILDALPSDPDDPGSYWPGQNLRAVLDRWGTLVPPERTHIVVCPVDGAAPDLLWQRFAEAIGLASGAVDLTQVPRGNESLGVAQIAFLRQVVAALDGRLEQPWFSRVAKRWFAQSVLSLARSRRPVTPADVVTRLAPIARSWTRMIVDGGYPVHGDLGELVPQPPPPDVGDPDDVSSAEMLEGLPEVVAEMLIRARDDRIRLTELEREHADLAAERDRLAAEVEELSEAGRRRRRWRH